MFNTPDEEKIARHIYESADYHVSATGFRGVGISELTEIIKIIRSNDSCSVAERLSNLYKNHPCTIELNRSLQEDGCPKYNSECDCFYPDVGLDNCFCRRERRKELEKTKTRNCPEYTLWRNHVFERDNYTCQYCSQRGGTLNAHHIKPYSTHPKLRFSIGNGVTLCEACHKLVHSKKATQ